MPACPYHINSCGGCQNSDMPEYDSPWSRDDHRAAASNSEPPSLSGTGAMTFDSTPTSSIFSVESESANRIQLKEELLKIYFPALVSATDTDFLFSKLVCRHALAIPGPSIEAAVDALSLFCVGRTYGDERLIHAGKSKYQLTVSMLNLALVRPEAMHDDGILGTIYILGFCDLFRINEDSEQKWWTHLDGLQRLLVSRGPRGDYAAAAQMLVYNSRNITAIAGTISREPSSLAGRDWANCSAVTNGHMALLTQQMLRLPFLLQRADRIASTVQVPEDDVIILLSELAVLDRDAHNWLLQWYSSFETSPYWWQDRSAFSHWGRYAHHLAGHFERTLCFPSFAHASAQTSYWVCLIQMKQASLRLHNLFVEPLLPISKDAIISEIDDAASRLCESVMFCISPQFGLAGVLCALRSLQAAQVWFLSQESYEKCGWCQVSRTCLREEHGVDFYYREATDTQ